MAATFDRFSPLIGPEHLCPKPGLPSTMLVVEAQRNLEAVVNRLLRYETEEMEHLAEVVFDAVIK